MILFIVSRERKKIQKAKVGSHELREIFLHMVYGWHTFRPILHQNCAVFVKCATSVPEGVPEGVPEIHRPIYI